MPLEVPVHDLLENAAVACRAKRCEDAIAALERFAQLVPDNSATHYHLGYCYAGGCQRHSLVDAGKDIMASNIFRNGQRCLAIWGSHEQVREANWCQRLWPRTGHAPAETGDEFALRSDIVNDQL